MSDVYTAAYYHLVWATKNRAPLLVPEAEVLVWSRLRHICEEMSVWVYAVGGMPDHVHIVCGIPPAMAVSQAVKKLKGSSSHFANHLDESPVQDFCLYWQHGYGMHTFSRRDLPGIVRYVEDQKRRHNFNRLWPNLEITEGEGEDE